MNTKQDANSSHIDGAEYRDRLRTWLVKMIDSGNIPGLRWENVEKTIFRMPWKHAGRQDYNLEEDSKIFMAWAKHSGRYREGIDKPEPIVWKTRLRCALNKMPDIKELPNRSRLDISEPYRVYQLLPPVHKASQIRRRFYHRSQSQDINNPKEAENTKQFQPEYGNNHINDKRTPIENVQLSNSINRISPLPSGNKAVHSPGFWFTSSVNVPLKTSMSADLLHIPRSGSTAVDTISQLKSFAQGRYPLISSMNSPFVPFTSTPISSYYNSTNNLEALKQYGLTNAPTVNGYVNQIAVRAMEAEQSYQRRLTVMSEEGEQYLESSSSCENENLNKLQSQSYPLLKSSQTFFSQNLTKEKCKSAGEKSPTLESGDDTMNELRPLYLRLDESHRRIQALEMDLKQSRQAHARERKEREQLEAEKEEMKTRLEQMSRGLRELASHIIPQNQKNIQQPVTEVKVISTSDDKKKHFFFPQNFTNVTTIKREVLSDVEQHNSSTSNIRTSLLEVQKKNSNFPSRKRPASPLDLTVHPNKRCTDENLPPNEAQFKLLSSNSTLMVCRTSSPTRSLSSDDKRYLSPFSSSSATPDSIGRSRSLSPMSGNTNILRQHLQPGTIQVS